MLKLIIPDLKKCIYLICIWPGYVLPLLTSFELFINVHLYSRLVIIHQVQTMTPVECAVNVSVYEWFGATGTCRQMESPLVFLPVAHMLFEVEVSSKWI